MPSASKIWPAAVAVHGADAHLAHDLEQAAVDGLGKIRAQLSRRIVSHTSIIFGLFIDRGVDQIRVDGVGPVADQRGKMVHLTRLARHADQADLHAQALFD